MYLAAALLLLGTIPTNPCDLAFVDDPYAAVGMSCPAADSLEARRYRILWPTLTATAVTISCCLSQSDPLETQAEPLGSISPGLVVTPDVPKSASIRLPYILVPTVSCPSIGARVGTREPLCATASRVTPF